MVAFTTRMPGGFPGQLSRDPQQAVVEVEVISATNTPTAYGVPVITANNQLQGFVAGDTVAQITGILVRPYPFQSAGNVFGNVGPVAGDFANRLRQGYVFVPCAYGTPTVDGAVYVRTATDAHGAVIGTFEATSDPSSNAVWSVARWTGAADAYGNAELCLNF